MSNTLRSTSSSRAEHLDFLRNKVREMSSPKGQTTTPQYYNQKDDPRYWKLEVDKAGTGSAVIRFLHARSGAAFPFVRYWKHGFQGPSGKWLIDNCPSSLHDGDRTPSDWCPVCKDNTRLYNLNKDKECPHKKVASSRKRKLSYVSNILVVNDPKHPENNGKVFLYQYGKQIFDMIRGLMDPPAEFADMTPINAYDPEFGANFKLRQIKADGFPNYDKKSSFDETPSAIGDEDFIASIEAQMHDLNTILDPKLFKSYEKLQERFTLVCGEGAQNEAAAPAAATSIPDDAPVARTPRPAAAPQAAPRRTATPVIALTEPEDDEEMFRRLANQNEDE